MKSNAVHVIKSVRIAKARMVQSSHFPNFKTTSQDKHKQLPTQSNNSQNNDPKNSKKELSQSTKCSLSPRANCPPNTLPLKIKFPKTESTNLIRKPPIVKSSKAKSKKIDNSIICKRIKVSGSNDYKEDKLPWTDPEMTRFEVLYGELLFDNTIDLHISRQADLDLLTQRPFHSYRNTKSGLFGDRPSGEISSTMHLARQMIERSDGLNVTESQLINLMNLCQTEKDFFDILKNRRDVLVNFLEKTKLNPRRKVLK